ncbi:hypothetical protein [Embleya sp. NPDC050493]|uniref:hypothetical protein n=1 Tax=Embleya sp. NPDC050493 TaxID=3363989 RepID=UPI0037B2501B
MTIPAEIRLNAWTGDEAAQATTDEEAARWGAGKRGIPRSQAVLPFGPPTDPRDWRSADVGYGILLPDSTDPNLSDAAKAAGEDADAPIRELLTARPGTVVLRWSPDLPDHLLRRYFAQGRPQEPAIGLSEFGTDRGRLPRYVVIVGGPEVIPWSVQYALGTRHLVGRIPLSGEPLARYVRALLANWSDAPARTDRALSWTVDHGPTDITALMRAVIAAPLAGCLTPPPLAQFRDLVAAEATGAALLSALTEIRPGLLATSSHGRTGPLGNPTEMRAVLGLPVDGTHTTLPLDALCGAVPGGCVWYAQACCSAGAAGESFYAGLLPVGSSAFGTVEAVASLGTMVAPAALELLGRENPVRAVLGHVEPTFSWTLQVENTGQGLGGRLVSALSTHLYAGEPLGLALAEYRADVGELHTQWARLREMLAAGDTSVRETLTRLRVSALDRQSLVLLGDPTVALPALGGAGP